MILIKLLKTILLAQGNNMAEKISAVYKITNTVTKDFYIGSSKNVKRRWAEHRHTSVWKKHPNNPMYQDMQKYGVNKFDFQIFEEVEPGQLKETEQRFIELLKPTYNSNRANGFDIERYNEYQIEYYQQNREKRQEYQIEYYQQNHKKCKEYQKEYNNQLCCYNNEILTLNALYLRFRKNGIEHPKIEAKKYLIKKESNNVIEFYDIYS